MSDPNLIEVAIGILGSESKLADAAGFSQVAINKAKRRVADGHRVSGEMAAAIDRATGGAVPKWNLRPDLFDAPAEAIDPGGCAPPVLASSLPEAAE